MSRYSEWAEDRPGFLAKTGVPPEEMARYLPAFAAAIHGDPDGRLEPEASVDDLLLFIWLHNRMGILRATLAMTFGLSSLQVDTWIERLEPAFQRSVRSLSTTVVAGRDLDVLRRFNAREVRYLIVGGQAVAHHGYLRPILDLDLFVAAEALNAARLALALEDLAPGVDPRATSLFQLSDRVIRLGSPPFTIEHDDPHSRFIDIGRPPASIEILTTLSAVTFDECEAGRVMGRLGNVSVPIIGLEHLRINKAASIRGKDGDDLKHLL